jgi:hypothetical protein
LGLFSVLTLVAFVLVFLFVEETKQVSLEDLDFVYGVRKKDFMHFQVYENLPWAIRKYLPWYIRECLPDKLMFLFLRRKRGDNLKDPETHGHSRTYQRPEAPEFYVRHSEEVFLALSSDDPRA